jgi:single-strand DNA-binding protein
VDHNRFHGLGRLVRPPEFFPPGRKGQEHCTFTLAINRVVPNEDGPAADYIPCSIWGEESRRFCSCRDTGDEVLILGRIRTNFVQRADGKRDFFWEVRVEEVEYGRKSLKNLRAAPVSDATTQAVKQLTDEFGG